MKTFLVWLTLVNLVFAQSNKVAKNKVATIKGMGVRSNIGVTKTHNTNASFVADGLIHLFKDIYLEVDISGESYFLRSLGNRGISSQRLGAGLGYAFINEGSGYWQRSGDKKLVGFGAEYSFANLTDEDVDYYKESFQELGLRFFASRDNEDGLNTALSIMFKRALDVDLNYVELFASKCINHHLGVSIMACTYNGLNQSEDYFSRGKYQLTLYYKNNSGVPLLAGLSYSLLSESLGGIKHTDKYPGFYVAIGLMKPDTDITQNKY